MIAANLDIRRYEVWDFWVGAAKHDVFSPCFYVVVNDVIRTGPVPSTDCLRVGGDGVYFGYVRIDYRSFSTVQTDSALEFLTLESVNPHTIEDQMMRHAGEVSLRIASESDEIVDEVCRGERRDVEPDQFVMVGGSGSFDYRLRAEIGAQLGEQSAL